MLRISFKILLIIWAIFLSTSHASSSASVSEERLVVQPFYYSRGIPQNVAYQTYVRFKSRLSSFGAYQSLQRGATELEDIEAEVKLSHSNRHRMSQAIELGQRESATRIVQGNVYFLNSDYDSKNKVWVSTIEFNLTIIDPARSAILHELSGIRAAASSRNKQQSILGAIEHAVNQAWEDFQYLFPSPGTVQHVDGSHVWLNIGSHMGLRNGTFLKVNRPLSGSYERGGDAGPVGVIKVDVIEPQRARAQILTGEGDIHVQDAVSVYPTFNPKRNILLVGGSQVSLSATGSDGVEERWNDEYGLNLSYGQGSLDSRTAFYLDLGYLNLPNSSILSFGFSGSAHYKVIPRIVRVEAKGGVSFHQANQIGVDTEKYNSSSFSAVGSARLLFGKLDGLSPYLGATWNSSTTFNRWKDEYNNQLEDATDVLYYPEIAVGNIRYELGVALSW